MTGFDYEKAKSRNRGRHGEPVERRNHTGPDWPGLRSKWDGPAFPVVTTLIADSASPIGEPIGEPIPDEGRYDMTKLRIVDYRGFVPDELLTPDCQDYDTDRLESEDVPA